MHEVWVDCTAAAHPLVLRPIIERLEARGHEVVVTAREYGQTLGILERLGIPYTAVGAHGGASTAAARRGRSAGALGAAGAGLVWERRPRPRARPRLGRPRRRLGRCFRDPLGADAGLRVRRPAAPDRLPGRASGCWSPTRSRSSGWRRSAPRPSKLFRYPGPEGGVLPRRLRARRRRCSTSSGSTARRSLVVVRPPPETSEYHARNDALRGESIDRLAAAPATRRRWSSPAPRPRAPRSRALRRRQPDRPRARDRRPEPDRLRRPRGQRRRDDEPRGGRARHPRLHDLHRPHGRRSTRR